MHSAYLDGVAVTLGTHPFVVEAARELLETPPGRAMMIEEVRRARERLRRTGLAPGEERGTVDADVSTHPAEGDESLSRGGRTTQTIPGPPVPPKDAEELIAEARASPFGIRFLLQAPPETVAITFGVHPFLVFRARGLIRTRKIRSPDADSEEVD
jgi:hypothetical protein